MFLWVRLVLATIMDQESIQDLREAVDRLPAGLPGVYEFPKFVTKGCAPYINSHRYKNILHRLRSYEDDRQRLRAERILGWLTLTFRPLKAWEVCDGLVFHEREMLNNETKLSAGVLDICKPLVEEREGGTIALVHFSARECVSIAVFHLLKLILIKVPAASLEWTLRFSIHSSCRLDDCMSEISSHLQIVIYGRGFCQYLLSHRQGIPRHIPLRVRILA
jgi:hypothetical protein